MTRYQLEDKFRQTESGRAAGYLRVTAEHKIDLFVGVENGRRSLLLLCDEEPPRLPVFETITCTCRQRDDGRWAVVVCLERKDLSALFAYLAEDLVHATAQDEDSRQAARRLVDRLKWWQRLLSRGQSSVLGSAEIRGLMGELLFLRDCAVPAVGAKAAIDAWVGPFDAPRDFRFADLDVEVKALTRDAATVRISSLEQLEESGAPIVLCKAVLESAIGTEDDAVSVHQMVESVQRLCEPDADCVAALNQRLWALGYVERSEYQVMYFQARGMEFYACDSDFPKMTSASVAAGIVRAMYEIDLSSIRKFKVANWQRGGHE